MKPLTREQLEHLAVDLTETPELRPGMDFRRNQAYFTIPVPQFETKKVGKGKDAKEVEKRVVKTWILAADRGLAPYDDELLAKDGFRPAGIVQAPNEDRWPKDGPWSWSAYAFGECADVDPVALYDDIREVFTAHIEFGEETYHDIASLYVIGSYLFRIWNAYPYIHLNGTRATGKSQTLSIMVALGLNARTASQITASALLRSAAGNPGLICVDEAEQLSGEKGEAVRLLLNGGYKATGTAQLSVAQGDNWVATEFPVYGPKVLASINPLEPTIQSRCIVISTHPAIRTIPNFRADRPEWGVMRGRLYAFAMQNASRIADLSEEWEGEKHDLRAPKLISRQWEIGLPLVVLADYIGGDELADRVIRFLEHYYEEQAKHLDEIDRARTVLRALPHVIRTKTPVDADHHYFLKDIHEVALSQVEEDAREKITTRTISRQLIALGFRDRKTITGGTAIRLDPEAIRTEMRRRRVEPLAEDAAWVEADELTIPGLPPAEPAPTTKPEFDWLNSYIEENSE